MTFKMPLSPIDHIFTGEGAYPINFIFQFESKIDGELLKESLAKTLEIFLPLKAHLKKRDEVTLEFVESEDSFGWSEQELSTQPPLDDFAQLDSLLHQAQSSPDKKLLEITLSHFQQKSYLGVSASHCVVDGYSYFMFLTAWSKIFRELPCLSPDLDREKLIPDSPRPRAISPESILKDTGFSYVKTPRPSDHSKVKWKVLNFEKKQLDELYSQISKETDIRLSLNDVLSAELWKSFAREHVSTTGLLTFACAFDYRRIFPKIDALYFGNAIRAASIQIEAQELESKSSVEIAIALNKAVKNIDVSAVQDSLDCLSSLRHEFGLEALQYFHVAHPDSGLLVTNLSRLPLFEIDFGAGAPSDFRILTPAKRTAVILPLKDGIRIQIAT